MPLNIMPLSPLSLTRCVLVQIWVRRAGPNYQEGLKNMKAAIQELGLKGRIFGPEMHVSGIVPLALVPGRWEESKVQEYQV